MKKKKGITSHTTTIALFFPTHKPNALKKRATACVRFRYAVKKLQTIINDKDEE